MIIDEIKKDNMQAMKDRNTAARSIYNIIMNKVMLLNIELKEKGATVEDADVVQIIQKTIKELTEERENYLKANNQVEADNVAKQKAAIEKYLPKMLNEQEIKNIIESLDDKSIPSIMRHFKENYAGLVDMGVVNKLARG